MAAEDIRTVFARNLRAALRRRKMNVTTLADLAGVSRSGMFSVLACETGPTIDWVARVAIALDLEPADLLAMPPPRRTAERP